MGGWNFRFSIGTNTMWKETWPFGSPPEEVAKGGRVAPRLLSDGTTAKEGRLYPFG